MKASVKNTVDQIMAAIGPVFYQVKDYETIRLATAIVMAKVILSTPDTGKELEIFDATSNDILHALEQLLQIEAAEKAKLAQKLDRGINGFAHLVEAEPATILSESGPALVGDVIAAANKFTEEEYEELKESVIKLHTPDRPSAEDENDVASAIEESEKKDAEWTNVRRIMAEEVDQCRQDEDETIKDA